MTKLLATNWVPEAILLPYRAQFTEIILPTQAHSRFTAEEAAAQLPGCQALFTLSGFKVTPELLSCAPELKVVCNFGVGYDNIDTAACTARGIAVINTPKAVCQVTAEYAVALMMALTRGVVYYDRQARSTLKTASACFFDRDMLLYGKTLGVLGFGRIGQEVARKARGLGMRVVYYNPHRREAAEQEIGAEYASFDEVVRRADVLTCHMPYKPENHHIIGREVFAAMKPTAYFVNTARGPIVDEAALLDACRSHAIRGAALDVFEHEPDISAALTELDNVILSPHAASCTLESRRAMAAEALDGALCILRGEAPENLVNPEALHA